MKGYKKRNIQYAAKCKSRWLITAGKAAEA